MESSGTVRVEELLNLAERAGLQEDPRTLGFIRRVCLSGDSEAASILREHLARKALPHIIDGNPFSPLPTSEQFMGAGGFDFGSCPISGGQYSMFVGEPEGNVLFRLRQYTVN